MRWYWGLLCTRPTRLFWIFILLAHWNNSTWVEMSPHLDTLSWFQANQSLLFLLNAACLVEKQLYSLWFDPIGALTNDLPHSRLARSPLQEIQECTIYTRTVYQKRWVVDELWCLGNDHLTWRGGGGLWLWKPPTYRNTLTNFIT